jgi:hypothetical protein
MAPFSSLPGTDVRLGRRELLLGSAAAGFALAVRPVAASTARTLLPPASAISTLPSAVTNTPAGASSGVEDEPAEATLEGALPKRAPP